MNKDSQPYVFSGRIIVDFEIAESGLNLKEARLDANAELEELATYIRDNSNYVVGVKYNRVRRTE